MNQIISITALCALAACGGSSSKVPMAQSPTEVATNLAQTTTPSSETVQSTLVNSNLTTSPNAPRPTPEVNGDASFGVLLNQVRDAAGVNGVTYNAQLDLAAQRHADDMLSKGYFSHTSANGDTLGDRARAAGYDYRTVGENIASGYRSEDGVMNGWQNSPGHRRNNERASFEEFGLGYAGNGRDTRWVLVLGAQ